jgi:hypothetical protein
MCRVKAEYILETTIDTSKATHWYSATIVQYAHGKFYEFPQLKGVFLESLFMTKK